MTNQKRGDTRKLTLPLIGIIATKNYRNFKNLKIDLWSIFAKFGAPLIPAGLTIWVMRASDRWFVMNILSSYDLRIYSVGAKFAMLVYWLSKPLENPGGLSLWT